MTYRYSAWMGGVALCIAAGPAAADYAEFWFQNKSAVEVRGIWRNFDSTGRSTQYLKVGQGLRVYEDRCWGKPSYRGASGCIDGFGYEMRLQITNIEDGEHIYCEAQIKRYFRGDTIVFEYRIIGNAPGRECTIASQTTVLEKEGGGYPTPWFELRINR